MANINDAFPSKYLKASDLKGGQPVVVVDHVAFEPVGRNREMKGVVYFRGKDKGLVLNRTNANKLTQLAGTSETDDWAGTRAVLYGSEAEFGGETFECIRIKATAAPARQVIEAPRAPEPAPRRQDATDEMVDGHDIPF